MTIRVFVPADSSALSVGAGDVALAIAAQAAARGSAIELVRNGSRGLSWLEPLVEVATPAGRVAYGPVTVADVPGLLDAGFLAGADHPLALGLTDEIPYLEEAGAAHLCPRRHHRSAVPG
jgi:formate dehydrogenase iron-sulfur subunit